METELVVVGEVREGESSRAAGPVGRGDGVEAVLPIAVAGVGAARCCCSSSAAATGWRDWRSGGEGTERKAGRVRGASPVWSCLVGSIRSSGPTTLYMEMEITIFHFMVSRASAIVSSLYG